MRIFFALRGKEYLSKKTYQIELSKAFAYAATQYFPLYLDNESEKSNIKTDLVFFLKNDKGFSQELSESINSIGFISVKGNILSNEPEFIHKLNHIDNSFDYLDVLRHSSKLAVHKPNFILLHVITVGHCLWYLENKLPHFYIENLKKYYAHFVLYTYLAENLTVDYEEKDFTATMTKEYLLSKFSSLQAEHSIKSLFSLLELYDATGEQCFLQAADSFIKENG